jgi:hypothetical protein
MEVRDINKIVSDHVRVEVEIPQVEAQLHPVPTSGFKLVCPSPPHYPSLHLP